jgi:electron transport complex protein RnfA
MNYLAIVIGAVFVGNIVLAQFLGICPFLGVSKKVETAAGMSMAVTFVMLLASIITYGLWEGVLKPLSLEYMQTIVFILVIATLVQLVELFVKKASPSLYEALGVYLPLITTNCAVLGIAILNIQKGFNLLELIVHTLSVSLGFGMAIILFAGIRERLVLSDVPNAFKDFPVALITAGLMAIAFLGFSGFSII